MKSIGKERLVEMIDALEQVAKMDHFSVGDSVRRTLKLLELLPWLEGETPARRRPKAEAVTEEQ